MTVKKNDLVRTRIDTTSVYDDRPVPAGTTCTVVDLPDGGIMADVTFREQTADDDGEFDQIALLHGQYEVIRSDG